MSRPIGCFLGSVSILLKQGSDPWETARRRRSRSALPPFPEAAETTPASRHRATSPAVTRLDGHGAVLSFAWINRVHLAVRSRKVAVTLRVTKPDENGLFARRIQSKIVRSPRSSCDRGFLHSIREGRAISLGERWRYANRRVHSPTASTLERV